MRGTSKCPCARSQGIKNNAPNAFVVVISNPLDAMVYEMKKVTGFAREKVVGMAGVLDSARFQCFVAEGCAAYLDGEYGYKDIYMGVPVVIGLNGVEKVINVTLSADEKKALDKSAEAVRELIAASKTL